MSLVFALTIRNKATGQPRDADVLPTLADAITGAVAGVIRLDTGAVVVPAGEPFVRQSLGVYTYPLTGVVAGVAYRAYRRLTLDNVTQVSPQTRTASPLSVLPSYLTLGEGDAFAAGLPLLTHYAGTADANARVALLALATMRVNRSRRWQGRKWDPQQKLEFPRMAYESRAAAEIWDFDDATQTAVVPQDVKLATLYEADSIADGTRDRIAAAIAAGLTGQSTGSVSEQYRQIMAGQAGVQSLCPEAEQLVARYRLASGRLL